MELTSKITEYGIFILQLAGRMDVQGVTKIDRSFASAVADQSGPVVVDMSEITYIATVGIKAFLVQGKILNAQDKQMVLAQPIDAVQTVFTRTGMDKILPITDSIDAAIKRVAAE